MDFLLKGIEEYSLLHTEKEPQVLQELTKETWLKALNPRMLSGHLQGRFIATISNMIQPKRILEIGTYTGYSTICWAEGLLEGGEIITIDVNDELESLTRKYFQKAKIENAVDYRLGNALEIIPTLNEVFDIVFIDADKENYLTYYNLIFDKVRKGGYIIADNVLWSGKVVEPVAKNDIQTQKLMEYTQFVSNDSRVKNILLPLRDGLLISMKK